MTGYSDQVREEIYNLRPAKGKHYPSFCYGLLLMGRRFDEQCVAITTEHLSVSKLYGFAVKDCCGLRPAFTTQKSARGGALYSLALTDKEALARLMAYFSHTAEQPNRQWMEGEGLPAFIAGAFLACGSISEPAKAYHMAFCPPMNQLCDLLFELLTTAGYPPKSGERREETMLYFKESSQIEDLLTLMGAVKSSLDLMEMKIYKDLRNRANRATNCETANIDKLVRASSAQMEDILLLRTLARLDTLPKELVEVALLREENPSASLSELAQLSGISRSGINHRLKRIGEAAARLRDES